MAIAPDLGERYLDTVYQTNWLHDLYGEDVLDTIRPDRRSADDLTHPSDAVASSLVR